MKILLLGGSGFIGSHLAENLLASGHEVSIFQPRNASRKNIAVFESLVNIHEGDFNRPDDLIPALVGMEVVVHLVNTTLPGNSLANPVYDIQTNVIGSLRLQDLCLKAGVQKIVFISSGGTVYGIPRYSPLDEDHPLHPIAPYGISKLMIEKYLEMYHYHYGLDYTVLRVSNPYGDRQDPHRGQGVLAAWMYRVAKDEPIDIWGDGSVVRDYIYIKDTVDAIELACTRKTDEKIFNVGSGVGYSLSELHQKLEKHAGRPVKVNYKSVQKVDVPINVLNVDLFSRVMHWQAKTSIDEGMSLMWEKFNAI